MKSPRRYAPMGGSLVPVRVGRLQVEWVATFSGLRSLFSQYYQNRSILGFFYSLNVQHQRRCSAPSVACCCWASTFHRARTEGQTTEHRPCYPTLPIPFCLDFRDVHVLPLFLPKFPVRNIIRRRRRVALIDLDNRRQNDRLANKQCFSLAE